MAVHFLQRFDREKIVIISLKHDICDFFRCEERYVVNESSVADPDPLGTERLLFGSGSEQKSLGSATHLHTKIYVLYAILQFELEHKGRRP